MENNETYASLCRRLAANFILSGDDFDYYLVQCRPGDLLSLRSYVYCVNGQDADVAGTRLSRLRADAQQYAHATDEACDRFFHDMAEYWRNVPDLCLKQLQEQADAARRRPRVLQFMDEVEPREAEYLVEPYLPLGMLTVLGGVSGVGKTWLALSIAAAVSAGRCLPFEQQYVVEAESNPRRTPGTVYYFTQENDPNIVLRPRLEALGADLANIAILRPDPDAGQLTLCDPRLEVAAQQRPPALVVFDPIQSYLGAGVEMNKANEVRPILDYLASFSKRYNCAVVLVSHMSKPGANNTAALDRLLGSSDFRNAARSIIIVGSDPEDRGLRVFAHAKNSVGTPGESQTFRVTADGVAYLGTTELTADEIVRPVAGVRGRPATALSAAVDALKELLGEKGWATREEVEEMCRGKGISGAAMYRAKDALNLRAIRCGPRDKKYVWWLLPETDPKTVKTS